MNWFLKSKTSFYVRMFFILVSLFVFQSSIITVSASILNLELNPYNPVSETCTYDENEGSGLAEGAVKADNGDIGGGLLSLGLGILDVGTGGSAASLKTGAKVAAKGSGRVFWSGQSAVAGKAAENFARANGMKTLEMTWQGKALTRLTNATSYKFTAPLWNRASASFARGATGPVNVFHNASSGVRLNSVWRNVEYPILKGNNNNIIYHNVFK